MYLRVGGILLFLLGVALLLVPQTAQAAGASLSGSDSVTLYKADSSGALDGLLDSLERGWSYVLEYFR